MSCPVCLAMSCLKFTTMPCSRQMHVFVDVVGVQRGAGEDPALSPTRRARCPPRRCW